MLNFASVGFGSSSHLAAEIFVQAAGINAVHVPFKSVADSYTETLAGQVHFFVYALPSALGLLKDGRLRPLAITATKRNPAVPDIPTVVEAGLPQARFDNWNGIVLPPGTPSSRVSLIAQHVQRALRAPEAQEKFARQGAETTSDSNPAHFGALLKSEYERYEKIIRALKPTQ
jgi:tripartite-type tricarboxylate transporter receptor subunit TctC